jgi:ankyrin repeat protein
MAAAGGAMAGSPDIGAFRYTSEARQSWKALVARQLHAVDPTHAQKLSKLASAVIDGQLTAVTAGINSGASPSASLKGAGGDMSLLGLGVAACQDKITRELVLLGASANGDGASTSLVVAAAEGQGDLAEFLIQHGASVDTVDANGHSALEEAVRQHQASPVSMLLKHGSNPNIPLAGGARILDLIAYSSDPDDQRIAAQLVAYGASSGLGGGISAN